MVGVNQALATLIYVQKTGGEKKSLVLKGADSGVSWWKFEKKINVRFENNGNVHLVPRGKIEIKDSGKRIVGKGVINEGSVIVLPDSFRKIEVLTEFFFKWHWPGKYSTEIGYRYDGKDDFEISEGSTFYFGVEGVIIGLFLGLIAVVFVWKVRK
jgi:hypothetical protein